MRILSRKNPIVVVICLCLILINIWGWNVKKLASCDFKSDYKCEVIHLLGTVVPPLSIGTVWFDDDGD